ncbi:MAG: hypothetical protein H6723_15145 [Sandaracinus sp.]|nr:hypothetical protein [Sandaracinus sp.]
MELLSSAAVALASSWEAEPEPFDREASQILVGARLLVAGDDPVATDGLVGHLRAHGASVGVTDARGRGLDRLGFLDAHALLYDPRRAPEELLQARLDDNARLRGARLIPFYWDDVWPAGAVRPAIELLAHSLRGEIALDRELRYMAEARRSFPVPFRRLGAGRVLRALAGANGSVLRLVVAGDHVRAIVELGGDLVVSATTYGEGPTPRRVGVRALAELLAMKAGRAHVERHDLARVMTIMAPVAEALGLAEPFLRRPEPNSLDDTQTGELSELVAAMGLRSLDRVERDEDDDDDAPTWEEETTKKTLTSMPPEAFPDDDDWDSGDWDDLETPRAPEQAERAAERSAERAAERAADRAPTERRSPATRPSSPSGVHPRSGRDDTERDPKGTLDPLPRATVPPPPPIPSPVDTPRRVSDDDTTTRRPVEGAPTLAPTWLPLALARASKPRVVPAPARPSGRPDAAGGASARPASPPRPGAPISRSSAPPNAGPLGPPGSHPAVTVEHHESRAPMWWSLGLVACGLIALAWLVVTRVEPSPTGIATSLRTPLPESASAALPAPEAHVRSRPEEVTPPSPSEATTVALAAPEPSEAPTVTETPEPEAAVVAEATAEATVEATAEVGTDDAVEATAEVGTDDAVEPAAEVRTGDAPEAAAEVRTDDAVEAGAPAEETVEETFESGPPAPERFVPNDVWSSGTRDRERSDALLARAEAATGDARHQLLYEAALAHPGNPHVAFRLAREAQAAADLELAELWARHAIRLRRRRTEYRVLLAEIERALER